MRLKYLLFLFPAFLFISCEFEESDYRYNLGTDFISDPTLVFMIDTLTVNTYTTLIDSVITSREERLITGRFVNKLGVVTSSESYFRLDPTADNKVLHENENAVFDSACFILYPDGYHFGDTTKLCDLAIYPLTEDIKPDDESEYIYNINQFSCEVAPVATFSVNLNVEENNLDDEDKFDSIMIRVSDDYGRIFYDLVENEDTILEDKDLFTAKYKGYALKPANNENSCIIGFNATSDSVTAPKLRIYYHDKSVDDNLYFDYVLENFKKYNGDDYSLSSSDANCYTSSFITNDYSNSVFKGIDIGEDISENKLSGSLTNNVTLLQGGLDVRTRIELPSIDRLYDLGVGSVVKAVLYIEPMEGTFGHQTDLPSSLELFLVDSKNRSYGQMKDFDESTVITSSLNYNIEFKNQTYYYIDITRFLRDEYMSKGDPEYSLQLAYPQSKVRSSVDQVILKNQHYSKDAIKLKLYVTNYSNFQLKQ
jgi:hypothetical protein